MGALKASQVGTRVEGRKVVSRFSIGALVTLLGLSAPRAFAQQPPEAPAQEIVANLAAGRVVIAVVKDAILIATVENPIEAGTSPPTPVPLGSVRAGVILGSVDWFSP